MAQPKLPRCRRKAPVPAVRTMDLLGVGQDGALYLWQAESKVLPVTAFESRGAGIVSGHYVVDLKGSAVTVHCGNTTDGRVSVQYMCGGLETTYLPRKYVEAKLLGKVVKDPEKEAEILRMLQELHKDVNARSTAPHLRRGKL